MSNGHTSSLPQFVKRAVCVLAVSVLASVALSPVPGSAAPDRSPQHLTIQEAQQRIELLNHEAEIASEQLNAARVRLKTATRRLQTLQADVSRQRTRVDALRADVVGSALADYQSASGLSTTTSFLVANDPNQFMRGVATRAVIQHQQEGLLSLLSQQTRQLGVQEQQAQREHDAVANNKQALATHKAQLDHKTKQAEQVLHQLRVKQRERLAMLQAQQEAQAAQASRSGERASTAPATSPATVAPVAGSGRAAIAVSYALAQVGDPYVYGAAGPDAFDCSGLTMAAWAAAGVSIPHASSMQPGSGTPVSISALAPGDLVFYYSPISHVAMYIGNGQVVHAPYPGRYVEVVPMNSMPISMAVRIG